MVNERKHAPTLRTVIMVEETIRGLTTTSAASIADIKRSLPKQVNHNALMSVLAYLERTHSIKVTLHGVSWIKKGTVRSEKQVQ